MQIGGDQLSTPVMLYMNRPEMKKQTMFGESVCLCIRLMKNMLDGRVEKASTKILDPAKPGEEDR